MAWYDDFGRLSLGSDWADDGPIFEDDGYARAVQFLSGGAWQAEDSDSTIPDVGMGSIRRTDDNSDDQFIEASVGNFFQGHDPDVAETLQYVEGQIYLFAQVDPGSNAAIVAWVIIQVGPSIPDGEGYIEIFTVDATGTRTFPGISGSEPLPAGWQTNPDYTVKLEVSAAGHVRAYFEGDLLLEDDVTPLAGRHVGIGMEWNLTNYGAALEEGTNPGQPLRVNWARGSNTAATGWRVGTVGWGTSPW